MSMESWTGNSTNVYELLQLRDSVLRPKVEPFRWNLNSSVKQQSTLVYVYNNWDGIILQQETTLFGIHENYLIL